MPHHNYPRDEEQERAPDPREIVDRIINGRLHAITSASDERASR